MAAARLNAFAQPLMTPSFAHSLDALSDWRGGLAGHLDELSRYLAEHELIDLAAAAQVSGLRDRLNNEKLVVAFVAEFSRGKSELINAIFFGDTGRRVLPATPGRTTMCPVELAWDREEHAALMLLPIETRLTGQSLADLRGQRRAWTVRSLELGDPERLAAALSEVTRTRHVSREEAVDLGFWDDERPADNPPVNADGEVEVPAWRHALINYPHPLLKQGLVVLDTPGLNAIGAEPELTLGLLPTAHATVFILGADTGVTRSDLEVWRDHLGTHAPSRFVVLNKIDTLADPLASAGQVEAQIASQCRETARTLGVSTERVFPLSARQALAARIAQDDAALQASRLLPLESALGSELLPRRRQVLEQVVVEGAQQLENLVVRRVGDQRRQLAEQMLELRGLRGKSSGKLRLMIERVDAETEEFEQCTVRLQALRLVHGRALRETLDVLSNDRLRDEVGRMVEQMNAGVLHLGARKAFVALCGRLRDTVADARQRSDEIHDMLGASFGKLNGEFGFSLACPKAPELTSVGAELAEIEGSYTQYLGLGAALRLSSAKSMEQFRRMLVSKLRVVFEKASAEIELWNKSASTQIDAQLRERRRNFRKRRESLERVQSAAGDLEMRIAEIEGQDERLQGVLGRARGLFETLRVQSRTTPRDAGERITVDLPETELQRAHA